MTEMISATVLLFLIMDPLGNLPIFMSVLKHLEPRRRRVVLIRELLIALLLMLIFLFAGEKILAFLNLRTETVSISGGIILFLIAIKMIFPSQEGNSSGLSAGEEPFLVPLAIPLVAGPSILAALMLLSHQYPHQLPHLVAALLIAWGSLCGHFADVEPVPAPAGQQRRQRAGAVDGADSGDAVDPDVPGRRAGLHEAVGA